MTTSAISPSRTNGYISPSKPVQVRYLPDDELPAISFAVDTRTYLTWCKYEPIASQIAAAHAAVDAFYAEFRGGRSGRPPAWSIEQFRPVFLQTASRLRARLRRKPTQTEVFVDWPDEITWTTFRRRWQDCFPGQRWAELTFEHF